MQMSPNSSMGATPLAGAAAAAEPDSSSSIAWAQELAAVLESEEWEQLQASLHQESPGGGPAVAALLQRAAAGLVSRLQSGAQAAGGPNACTEAGLACQLVRAVQEASWEKLHTGSWHEVRMTWRDAYSAACILAAAAADSGLDLSQAQAPQHAGGERDAAPALASAETSAAQAAAAAALRHLDMAAMMGGPLLRPAVDPLIGALQRRWQRLHARRRQQHQQPGQEEGAASGRAAKRARAAGSPQPAGAPTDQATAGEGQAAAPRSAAGQAAGSTARSSIPLPPGSLGPRGTQLPAEHLPSLEAFCWSYMQPQQPCVITGAMEDWPGLRRWADPEYIRGLAGPRTVPVEVGRHYLEAQWGQQLMTVSDFLDQHILPHAAEQASAAAAAASPRAVGASAAASSSEANAAGASGPQPSAPVGSALPGQGRASPPAPVLPAPVGYLAQHALFEQIPELGRDIREPAYCVLGEGEVQAVNAWYGPPGTVTPLHTDPHHNLLCQVVGRKYVRLYSPDQTAALYPRSSGMLTNNSSIDLDELTAEEGAERFPGFTDAPFSDVVLEAGQMMYIPPGWWHYLKSLATSFSVSVWWH